MRRFRPYFHYLRPHRGTLAAAIFCGIIYGVAYGAGVPLMAKKVFPEIFGANRMDLNTWQLFLLALWLPAVFVVRGLAGYLNSYLIQYLGTRVLESIRYDYFAKLQVLPLSFFQKNTTGDLLSRGLADTNQLQFTLTTVANEIVKSPATLLGAIGYVAYQAYHERGVTMVLITLAVVPLTVLPIRYIGKKLIRRAGLIQAEMGAVTDRMSENLSATREVRAYNLEQREIRRFELVSNTLVRVQMKFVKYEKMLTPLIEIISTVGVSLTLVYAYKVRLEMETFMALIVALYACYEPVKKLGSLNNEMKRGLGALDRLEEVLNAPVTITDAAHAKPLPRAKGDIAFENLSFAYDPAEPVLRNVSIAIPAGTICALVGPSGAGKSTFANLVPRFFDPVEGRATVDGHDLRSLKLADLRRNIAIVSQDPVLFNDTIFNNLLIARPEASVDEVQAAARAAFAHDFITAFPQGYETVVGERGARLSGGQKQRIALARAFLRNAPILILDEATSALDSESEAFIQRALKTLVVGKTVLIIAHRFSTIRDASLILVFEKGEIVASGPHAELYSSSPRYKTLYDGQALAV
ncbi:ABC transporter ATP-binding protein [Opitutaceae bacterium EW11]|nr:ABC transporter ATP-binding protein [Opitutaceae bacterium EW11]